MKRSLLIMGILSAAVIQIFPGPLCRAQEMESGEKIRPMINQNILKHFTHQSEPCSEVCGEVEELINECMEAEYADSISPRWADCLRWARRAQQRCLNLCTMSNIFKADSDAKL